LKFQTVAEKTEKKNLGVHFFLPHPVLKSGLFSIYNSRMSVRVGLQFELSVDN